MAHIFLLGPSEWESAKKNKFRSPMQIRRELAKIFRDDQHQVMLMEDEPDIAGEDLVEKFDRLLHKRVTDIVVYWPPGAKMQTTYDELILLRDRVHDLKRPEIWIVHHISVASIRKDQFQVKERGGRSRYLTAIAKLGTHPMEWKTEADLREQLHLLSAYQL